MKRTQVIGMTMLWGIAGGVSAQAQLTIDDFSDDFQSEEFFTGVIPQPGETIPPDQDYIDRAGLEVGGFLTTSQGADPGDTTPPRESRPVEEQTQTGLSVLGGRRDARLEADPSEDLLGGVSVANSGSTDPRLSYSTDAGSNGATLELDYGQGSGQSLDLDLSGFDDGSGAFNLELTSGDLFIPDFERPVPATVTLWSDVGGSGSAQASSTLSLLQEQVYEWSFSDFSGIDFSDVDRIQLALDSTDSGAVDFTVSNFAVTPTPGPTALLGLGGLAAARRRRR